MCRSFINLTSEDLKISFNQSFIPDFIISIGYFNYFCYSSYFKN